MLDASPHKLWWTSREIGAARLPGLPSTQQGVEKQAKSAGWRDHPEFTRRRKGRGGGWEYFWKLFPLEAQKKLLVDAGSVDTKALVIDRDEAWRAFEALPASAKAKAQERLEAVQAVEALESAGTIRRVVVREIADMRGVSDRTIWNWLDLIAEVRSDDRLAYLAPRHRGTAKGQSKAECDPEFFELIKADYLRLEKPTFTSSYRRARQIAKTKGYATLPERTMRRRMNAEVSKPTQVLARDGMEALKRLYPAQRRDKTALHALEAVNADYHRWDVFVRWPLVAGGGEFEIIRPQMVAFQDVYSGRILSWRLDRTPNKSGVALALGDMIERFGIPKHMLLDNGREFANKFLTGQVETRNRFRIRDDDIPGLLVTLGVDVHWATPYSGQSKPIERAFRDMCDMVAKDPRLAGAYTGNRPDAKPENYGSKAIDLETFLQVVSEGIEEHNARTGRRSEVAAGRSFIEAFDASYATAPVRKATEEQRRLWLMGAEGLQADRRTGMIRFMKNEYWSDWMHVIAGQKVVARFDPADLWSGLHLYSLQNEYLGKAECRKKAGFFDLEAAGAHARARRQFVNAEKKALDAARRMKLADLAEHLTASAPAPAEPIEARVVKPAAFKKQRRPASPPVAPSPEIEAAQQAMIADFSAARERRAPQETDLQRFRRALEIEARLEAGEPVPKDQERWLGIYKTQPEYRSNMRLYEDFGESMFG